MLSHAWLFKWVLGIKSASCVCMASTFLTKSLSPGHWVSEVLMALKRQEAQPG